MTQQPPIRAAVRTVPAALALTLALTLALATGCEKPSASQAAAEAAKHPPGEVWLTHDQFLKAVQVRPAEQRQLQAKVVSTGRVTFDDAKVSHVFSPVSGRIESLIANVGDAVKAGAPLATINSPDLGNAFSDVLKAKADLTAAAHDLKRKQELASVHAVTQSDLEQSEDNYEKAKAEMERASAKVRMWKITKEDQVSQHFTLRSPLAGTVLMRNANPGVEIQGVLSGANIASELFTVGDYSSVWVYIDLYEVDLARVKPGQEVRFRSVSYPGTDFVGKVSLVPDIIDSATRTARVRCDLANPELKLKPEMYLTAAIYTGTKQALAVPRTAVQRLADQTIVFVQIPGAIKQAAEGPSDSTERFRAVPVRLGQEDEESVEIQGGDLKLGDNVVTSGGVLLSGML